MQGQVHLKPKARKWLWHHVEWWYERMYSQQDPTVPSFTNYLEG